MPCNELGGGCLPVGQRFNLGTEFPYFLTSLCGSCALGEGLVATQVELGLTGSNRFAAAAAKSLQSCPTLCDPMDGSPPGSAVPGILQTRTLEWVAISFSSA